MPVFIWEGDSKDGAVRGEMRASSRYCVISRLKKTGVSSSPDRIREKSSRRLSPGFAKSLPGRISDILKVEIRPGAIPPSVVYSFTRKFAVMIGAGIDISRALEVLGGQETNARFKRALDRTAESVRRGESLSLALGRHPEAFSSLYTGLVRAAETGGNMADIMMNFADSLQKSEQLRKKIKAAMVYPLIVMFTAVVVLFFAVSFLVPVFAKVFADMGAQLPALTQAVLRLGIAAQSNLFGIAVFVFTALFAPLLLYRRSERAATFMDGLILFIPVFGEMAHKSILARFCGTLSSLLRGGVPLVSALETVSLSAGNRFFSRAVVSVAREMVRGRGVAESFGGRERLFPPVFLSMIEAGEQSGKLRHILEGLADTYRQEADSLSLAVQSSVESAAIVIVGVAVSVIVISMYLPIFSLVSLFSR